MSTGIKLYGNKICPFAMRAWLVAQEKDIAYEYIHVPLGPEKPAWFEADINPRGTVPALSIQGKNFPESLIVAELLDDAFPDAKVSLMPKDSVAKGAVRLFMNDVGGFVGDCYTLLRAEAEKRDAAAADVDADVAFLEGALSRQSTGPFFLGEKYSLADIAIVPFLDRFRYTLKEYQNYEILAKAPRLSAMIEAASQRDSFKHCAQPAEFYVESYKSYAPKSYSPKK